MKKLLLTLLVISVIMSLMIPVGVGAFAEENANENYIDTDHATDFDIPVSGKAQGTNPHLPVDISADNAVISVHVSWDNPDFTYDFGNEWDPDELEYINVPGWNKSKMRVSVSNRSNCVINASVSFKKNKDAAYKKVKAKFETTSVNLDSAIDGQAKAYTFILNVSGRPNSYDKNYDIGKILVSIGEPKDDAKDLTSIPDEENPEYWDYLDKIASGRYTLFDNYVLEQYEYRLLRTYAYELDLDFDDEDDINDEITYDEDHDHHFVYDTFGRLVCTECGIIKHTDCTDYDLDGYCDECGIERGYTPPEYSEKILEFLENGGQVKSWKFIKLLNDLIIEYGEPYGFCIYCGYGGTCHCI